MVNLGDMSFELWTLARPATPYRGTVRFVVGSRPTRTATVVWATDNTFINCTDGASRLSVPDGTLAGSDIVAVKLGMVTSLDTDLFILGIHFRWYHTTVEQAATKRQHQTCWKTKLSYAPSSPQHVRGRGKGRFS